MHFYLPTNPSFYTHLIVITLLLLITSSMATKPRSIMKVVLPMPTSDGAGVKLYRAIGGPKLDMLDPFLMLDEFKSDEVHLFFTSQFYPPLLTLCVNLPRNQYALG